MRSLFEIAVSERKLDARYRTVFERYAAAYQAYSSYEGARNRDQRIALDDKASFYRRLLETKTLDLHALDTLTAVPCANLTRGILLNQLDNCIVRFEDALKALEKHFALKMVQRRSDQHRAYQPAESAIA